MTAGPNPSEVILTHKILVFAALGKHYLTSASGGDDPEKILLPGAEPVFTMEATGPVGTYEQLLKEVVEKAKKMGLDVKVDVSTPAADPAS